MRLPRFVPLYPVLGLLSACAHAIKIVPICTSSIYCAGDILQKVQLAQVFSDSKKFVDLKIATSQYETINEFVKLMGQTHRNPSRDQIQTFINKNFVSGNELETWNPPDFNPEPPILNRITDPNLRQFAKDIIAIWSKLGRKVITDVKLNPDLYSFIYVPNGFIIPGGRFTELYYWDSYWIVRGLLISGMKDTARGVIENLLHLADQYGYIPNGSRVYYIGRSQPPLLTAMVYAYFSATGDVDWLRKHMETVERELDFWMERKKTHVMVNGKHYMLLRYLADKTDIGPRPESYHNDYESARALPDEVARDKFYIEMKSAAESGWDFSTRWFVTNNDTGGDLTDVHASAILPVDLNAIFAGALEMAGDLRSYLQDRKRAAKFWSLAKYWRMAIDKVLWNEADGVWYDYDAKLHAPRKHFYPSCVTPLWAGAVEPRVAPQYAARIVKYLISTGALNYPGGIPTSLQNSGQQWDFPNAWPPLQSIMIEGLANSGHDDAVALAKELAKLWVQANYIGFKNSSMMFEKYSAVQPGENGGGGEYAVQDGFGWTNGVVLELLERYGSEMTLTDNGDEDLPTVRLTK